VSGHYEPARQLAEDTLPRMRRILGDDHPDTLHSATHLAAVLRELGQHEQAREQEVAIALRVDADGMMGNHPGRLVAEGT
jgi:Tetratricopeptide repeat